MDLPLRKGANCKTVICSFHLSFALHTVLVSACFHRKDSTSEFLNKCFLKFSSTRVFQVIDTQTKLYLVLELGDGGDLYDYIMKHEGGLEEDRARKYFRQVHIFTFFHIICVSLQIVTAIQYCHKLHVVHRDLKPENVVFFEKLGMVKLTDFGFSNKFDPGQRLLTSCGSLAYSAPEILLGDAYDAPAVDIWSLGVILYMLVCGAAPFQEANDSETLTMIMDCNYIVPSHISR